MATTPIKAPEVQTIDSILKTIQPAIAPLLANQQEQLGLVQQKASADAKGLEQGKINAFRGITNQAQAAGNTFSGIPIGEQARYTGEHYLPALANLKINAQNENIRIRDIMAQINKDAYMQAFGTNQKQQDNLFTYSRDEAGRYHGTSEREASQVYGTSERIGSQNFTAGENALDRTHQTSERQGSEAFQAAQNALYSNSSSGGSSGAPGFDSGGAVGLVGEAFDEIIAGNKDSYVSPDEYNQGRIMWGQMGGKANVYDAYFRGYANPQHLGDYGFEGENLGAGQDFGGGAINTATVGDLSKYFK